MVPRQFSTRTLLALMGLVAVCLAAHRLHYAWYVRNYPGHYLDSLLYARVHNGYARVDIARLFASGARVDVQTNPNVQRVWTSRQWPIAPGDEIWHFHDAYRHGVYLQFRDGRLVNHSNADFADPDKLAQINQQPQPPWPVRYGVWPEWHCRDCKWS